MLFGIIFSTTAWGFIPPPYSLTFYEKKCYLHIYISILGDGQRHRHQTSGDRLERAHAAKSRSTEGIYDEEAGLVIEPDIGVDTFCAQLHHSSWSQGGQGFSAATQGLRRFGEAAGTEKAERSQDQASCKAELKRKTKDIKFLKKQLAEKRKTAKEKGHLNDHTRLYIQQVKARLQEAESAKREMSLLLQPLKETVLIPRQTCTDTAPQPTASQSQPSTDQTGHAITGVNSSAAQLSTVTDTVVASASVGPQVEQLQPAVEPQSKSQHDTTESTVTESTVTAVASFGLGPFLLTSSRVMPQVQLSEFEENNRLVNGNTGYITLMKGHRIPQLV